MNMKMEMRMEIEKPGICYIHRHNNGKAQREALNPILRNLPKYSGGEAWDRCTYCAYLKGREDMRREILKSVENLNR